MKYYVKRNENWNLEEWEQGMQPAGALTEAEYTTRFPDPEPEPLTLEQVRLAKIAEINAGYDSVMGYIQSGYPDKETLTWERQAVQARELQNNPDAEAVFVRVLATVKGVSVSEMAGRILANAENWEPIAAMLTAQRQVMEEAALAAQSVADVENIRVSYTA